MHNMANALSSKPRILLVPLALVLCGLLYFYFLELAVVEPRNLERGSLPVLYKDISPQKDGKNIFLLETSFNRSLSSRFLCSLESFCNLNPLGTVWLIVTAGDLSPSCAPQVEKLKGLYPNLRVVSMDVPEVLRDTPLLGLLRRGSFWRSGLLVTNLSDLTRVAIVYRSGGLYTDSDILALQPVTHLKNFIALQSSKIAANGAFHFHSGHPFLLKVLKFLAANFEANNWAHNGPHAVTESLKEYCDAFASTTDTQRATKFHSQDKKECPGKVLFSPPVAAVHCPNMRVLEPLSFYPVHWSVWEKLFTKPYEELCVGNLFEHSYGVHLSNHLSSLTSALPNSAVNTIAATACPATSAQRDGKLYTGTS